MKVSVIATIRNKGFYIYLKIQLYRKHESNNAVKIKFLFLIGMYINVHLLPSIYPALIVSVNLRGIYF